MIKRYFFFTLAWLAVTLAILGIFLPVLPTTPFILVAAFAFGKSSPRFYRWLSQNEYFGAYLENYRSDAGVPIKIIWRSLVFLWISLAISACLWLDYRYWLVLLVVGIGASVHLLSLKRSPRQPQRFSLIELLVSLGIITVLASLLLPALNQARNLAKTASCFGNLRQIGLGLEQYADDHAGYIPNIIGTYMASSIPIARVAMGPMSMDFALGRLISYYRLPAQLLGCPFNQSRQPQDIAKAWKAGGTVYSAYIYRETDAGFHALKNHSSNSGKAMMMDFACISSNSAPLIPHEFKSVNILYQDGHACTKRNTPNVGKWFTTDANIDWGGSFVPPICQFIWEHADQ